MLFLAQVVETAASPEFDWTIVISTVTTTVLSILGWVIRSKVKNQRASKALELLAQAAAAGVSKAWTTYTAERKKASEDGKLTPEEAAMARKKAVDAALELLGDKGKALVQSVFKDGLDAALNNAVESEYAAFRQRGAASGAMPSANPPSTP